MLTEEQKQIVDKYLAEGYLNSAQIAKQTGLFHEYVEAYMLGI
jgi:hypothetical protein